MVVNIYHFLFLKEKTLKEVQSWFLYSIKCILRFLGKKLFENFKHHALRTNNHLVYV